MKFDLVPRVQVWPMRRCCIKWSMATACPLHLAVPQPYMISWWSAGTKTPWRDPRLKPSHGNWRTSSPWTTPSIKRLLWPTDPRFWSPGLGAVLMLSCILPLPSIAARPCMHGKTSFVALTVGVLWLATLCSGQWLMVWWWGEHPCDPELLRLDF